MRLLSITVRNYRSISKPSKVPVRGLTVLLGPNNEGKSNLLRALVTAMRTLLDEARGKPRKLFLREEMFDWDRDFPVQLQNSKPTGESVFLLEFELNAEELSDFKTEVGSKVRSPLPIEVRLCRDGTARVAVRKKGRGSRKITEKRALISKFIDRRLDFDYIPAVRTAESAQRVVERMVAKELAQLEMGAEYKKAIATVEEIQRPVLGALASTLSETLRQFLPKVKSVSIDVSSLRRNEALRRADVIVDDGVPTELKYKGDGVQSLAALALLRRAVELKKGEKDILLVVEEPESHLHPASIAELKEVISQIADRQQVVLSTHCPLFVDRQNVGSNVLVRDGRANPAKSLEEIRVSLGVRASDNLQHAELVLVVEGETDRKSIAAILESRSQKIKLALRQNRLVIDDIGGAGKLTYKLGLLRDAFCPFFVFLDGDESGKLAARQALDGGYATQGDILHASVAGLSECEFEDLLDEVFIENVLQKNYAVACPAGLRKGRPQNWSEWVREAFSRAAIAFDKVGVKNRISESVSCNPSIALRYRSRGVIDNLVDILERRLTGVD